jgi:hypothetical protein
LSLPVPINFQNSPQRRVRIILAASRIVGMQTEVILFLRQNLENLLDVTTAADDSNLIL